MERERLVGMSVTGKGLKLDTWGNSSVPLPTDPTALERGLEQ